MKKTVFRPFVLILVSILLLFIFSSCGMSHVPSKKYVLNAQDDISNNYTGIPREDFIKKWGKPQTTLENDEGIFDTWKVRNKYITVASVDGEVVIVTPSATLRARVSSISDGVMIIEPLEGQWEHESASQIWFYVEWLSEEDRENVSVGTVLVMEYTGFVQLTSPAQIGQPYFVAIED